MSILHDKSALPSIRPCTKKAKKRNNSARIVVHFNDSFNKAALYCLIAGYGMSILTVLILGTLCIAMPLISHQEISGNGTFLLPSFLKRNIPNFCSFPAPFERNILRTSSDESCDTFSRKLGSGSLTRGSCITSSSYAQGHWCYKTITFDMRMRIISLRCIGLRYIKYEARCFRMFSCLSCGKDCAESLSSRFVLLLFMFDYLTVHTVQVLPCASFKTTSCCGRNINMPMPCPCLPNLLQWQASSPGEALLPRSNPSSSSSRKKYSRLQTHHRDHSHSEMMNGQSFHNRCHSMKR